MHPLKVEVCILPTKSAGIAESAVPTRDFRLFGRVLVDRHVHLEVFDELFVRMDIVEETSRTRQPIIVLIHMVDDRVLQASFEPGKPTVADEALNQRQSLLSVSLDPHNRLCKKKRRKIRKFIYI